MVNKDEYKKLRYVSPISPEAPPWMDLHQIWFRGSSRRHNQLCGILWQSAQGLRFCRGGGVKILTWPVAVSTALVLPHSL